MLTGTSKMQRYVHLGLGRSFKECRGISNTMQIKEAKAAAAALSRLKGLDDVNFRV